MKANLKRAAAVIMISLALSALPSSKTAAARPPIEENQKIDTPENFHTPEKKLPSPFWKYLLWAAGALLVAGVAGLALSSSDSGNDTSNDPPPSGTGGFEGSW